MTVNYYIRHIFWGLLGMGAILYSSYEDNELKVIIVQISSIFSAFLYPYSQYFIESIALRYTNREFWHTGMLEDGVPKSYLLTLYFVFCFLLSIPLGISGVIYDLIRTKK